MIKLGQENCFRKWLPVKKKKLTVLCGMAGIESTIRGFAVCPSSRGHRSYLDYRWETGYNDGGKAIWPSTKRLRSVVFISKQTALDSSAQFFEYMPACQTEHFATTSQLFKKGGDVSTSLILSVSVQQPSYSVCVCGLVCGIVGLSQCMW